MNQTNLVKTLRRLILGFVLWSSAFCHAAEYEVKKTDRGVSVFLDGQLFTEYLIQSGTKPILWPIVGPTGKAMTRAFPMDKTPQETDDHIHQRSLWFSHGSVNGNDLWSQEPNSGSIVHRKFLEVSGGSTAKIVSANDWLDSKGKKLCEDERTIICNVDGPNRILDFDITIKATSGPVTFGDTKEGSFGIRVPDSMRVEGNHGGKIINANSQTDDNAWGKPADWVDYHGPVDNEMVGVAVLNHPTSYGYPTHWHVRPYGLFAANPFGLHDFENTTSDGSHTLNQGETMKLRYRIILHAGDEQEGRVAESFRQYSKEP